MTTTDETPNQTDHSCWSGAVPCFATTKRCSRCEITKSVSEFYWHPRRAGYRAACKACHSSAASALILKKYHEKPGYAETHKAKRRERYRKSRADTIPQDSKLTGTNHD